MATNQVIVLDNGSSSLKAGFAGEVKPSVILPAYVGRLKNERCMVDAPYQELFVGEEAEKHRGLLKLNYPLDGGVIKDPNDMVVLWKEVFSRLKVTTSQHPILVTDCALNPRVNKEALVKCAFETFGVSAVSVMSQSILSLYASARTSGAVLDCGEGGSRVAAVVEGFALGHSLECSKVGGKDVTELLKTLIRHQSAGGITFRSSAEWQIVKDIKEKVCAISPTPIKEKLFDNTSKGDAGPASYTLPDGTVLRLSSERFKAPEILFNPGIWGYEEPGVHELLNDAIYNSDMDLRRELCCNILLAGGSTLCLGFVDRLLNDFKKIQPKDCPIRLYAPPDRANSAFVGGAVVGMLPSFSSLVITKQQYESEGLNSIQRLNIF